LLLTIFSSERMCKKVWGTFLKMKDFIFNKFSSFKKQRTSEAEKEELPMAAGTNETVSVEPTEERKKAVDVHFSHDQASGQMILPIETEDSSNELDEEAIIINESVDEDYELPSIGLLSEPKVQAQRKDQRKINSTVKTLEETFASFGVNATITKAHVGPAVTRYEVYPEAGVKVSRILSLQDDLALALAAQDIRIEAPIPGKSAVWIEIPNNEIATVSLREVLDVNRDIQKKLLFALGRDISGDVVTGELNKMPHLLIAGATGSGKSV